MASRESLGQRVSLGRLSPQHRPGRRQDPEPVDLEQYSFKHRDYGEVAYYDQLVFKRHAPIPSTTRFAAEDEG